MKYVKFALLGFLMIIVVLVALANRGSVTLSLLPEQLSGIVALNITLPLFVVVLLSVLVGLMLGYLLEWVREHKHRKLAAQKKREVSKLTREVEGLKKQTMSEEEEVLALLR